MNGFQGDACPKSAGSSTLDRFGCRDTDNDGWSDNGDALPENPTQWIDRDGDGYGDNDSEEATKVDLFPSDGTQWNDTDGDGHGDNPYGTQGDWFPDDPTSGVILTKMLLPMKMMPSLTMRHNKSILMVMDTVIISMEIEAMFSRMTRMNGRILMAIV